MMLNIDGGKLYYEISENIHKTKKPILFVLPGGPGSDHSIYKFHSLDLENFCCVVYHDPRGCGKSHGFNLSTATMKSYINDIETLRKHLNISKVSLLGTSYGSMCAIGYAIKYPDNLSKLILIGGATSYRFIEVAKRNLQTRGSQEQKEISEYLWQGSFKNDDHVRDFMRIMRPLYSQNTAFNKNSSTNGPTFAYNVLNNGFGNFLKNFDFEPNLHKIICDILVLVGDSDWINDPVLFNNFSRINPRLHLHILQNCGHFVAIDRHEEYIKLIKEFISTKD